jgi:succinate-semialdehyde dehydrogenase/glutarate-semialdehyde dehydrogenase
MAFQTTNPTTGKTLQDYGYLSLDEAFRRVQILSVHQRNWESLSLEERRQYLLEIASRLRAQKQKLATQATLEMGKPLAAALTEIEKSASALEELSELALRTLEKRDVSSHYERAWVQPEPFGIIFSIQPWNFPYWQVFRLASSAWMSGNVIALKHSDEVAGCAELIEEICQVGQIQILKNFRLRDEDSAEIMRSRWIQAITVTGSNRTGKKVAALAGASLKKCVLELGGSDAYIILADADLDLAVKTLAQARVANSGQSCIAAKRFFVHESIFTDFKTRLKREMGKYTLGNPLDPLTQLGPLAGKRHLDHLFDQLKRAQAFGAKLDWSDLDLPSHGYFARPGILDFGLALSAFSDEEIFGPVASVYRFDLLSEVLETLNNGCYGLGGGIFTRDLALAEEVAKRVQVGNFVINSFVQSDPRLPFGGVKESGLGRELGVAGLLEFVNWKVVGLGSRE